MRLLQQIPKEFTSSSIMKAYNQVNKLDISCVLKATDQVIVAKLEDSLKQKYYKTLDQAWVILWKRHVWKTWRRVVHTTGENIWDIIDPKAFIDFAELVGLIIKHGWNDSRIQKHIEEIYERGELKKIQSLLNLYKKWSNSSQVITYLDQHPWSTNTGIGNDETINVDTDNATQSIQLLNKHGLITTEKDWRLHGHTLTDKHKKVLELNEYKEVLRAYNNKLRKRILDLLEKEWKPMKVSDIFIKLRLEQSVASQHLRVLKDAWLVTSKRESKCIYYSLNLKNAEENESSLEKIENLVEELTV